MLTERSLDTAVTADADLREVGLTSLDMVDLVLSVESELDLQIPEAQITPANFRSIAAIDALVSALRG
jgi:acyl carrier protein